MWKYYYKKLCIVVKTSKAEDGKLNRSAKQSFCFFLQKVN